MKFYEQAAAWWIARKFDSCSDMPLGARAAFVVAAPERDTGPVFIEGSRPVTEDQVREKLVSDGWSGVQVLRRGRIVLAMGSKDGRTEALPSMW